MASGLKALAVLSFITLMPAIVGCSPEKHHIVERSELPQIFYDPPKSLPKYAHIRLMREPGRLVWTRLRPSQMQAELPSAYLRSIDHPWQPYAEDIWDFAELGFDLNKVTPASTGQVAAIDLGGIVSMKIGGYSRTHGFMKDHRFQGDKIISDNSFETIKLSAGHIEHVYYSPKASEIDGAPALVSCNGTCVARLTITPEMAGMPSKPSSQSGYGPDGTELKIMFDESLIGRWSEIRAKALCFAQAVIIGFKHDKRSLNIEGNCSAVRNAISKSLKS